MKEGLSVPQPFLIFILKSLPMQDFFMSSGHEFAVMRQQEGCNHEQKPGQWFTRDRIQKALISAPKNDRHSQEYEAMDVHQDLPLGVSS
jgi:hypothetical protein